MADTKTFVELNIADILRALSLFWDGFTFSEVVGELLEEELDYVKTMTIVGIACNTHELHGDSSSPTTAQIIEYVVEGV